MCIARCASTADSLPLKKRSPKRSGLPAWVALPAAGGLGAVAFLSALNLGQTRCTTAAAANTLWAKKDPRYVDQLKNLSKNSAKVFMD